MVPELTVTDFTASLHFYADVLGFNIMIKRKDPDFAYISLGEAQLMLEQYHPDGWNTGELTRPFGRGINFQIEVDDIEQILARVHAHGVTLYRDLHDNHYRCVNCGDEIGIAKGHTLPPQNHHQHQNGLPIRWKLLVCAVQK
nr:VOC family protein [Kosakonia cowanii]